MQKVESRIEFGLRGTAALNEDQQDNGTVVRYSGLFWHVVCHNVFSQLLWTERLEVILQKRGKSKEECEAAFLRSCGPAICTASVPHGPLIKDMEWYKGHLLPSSLSLVFLSHSTHSCLPLSSLSLPPAAFLPSLLSFIPFLLISKRGWHRWLMWTHRCSSAVAAKIISCALCIRQSKYKSAEYTGNWTPAREKKGKKHKKTMRFCFCLTIIRSLMRMWRCCLPAVALCLLNWALARFRAAGWLSQSSTPTVLYTQPCQYLIWMHPGQHSFPSQAATQPASSQMEIYYFLLSTFWGH